MFVCLRRSTFQVAGFQASDVQDTNIREERSKGGLEGRGYGRRGGASIHKGDDGSKGAASRTGVAKEWGEEGAIT